MYTLIYELYVKLWSIRWLYQIGFVISWALWAMKSLEANPPNATWIVFGWIPAFFWPIEAIANWEWWCKHYELFFVAAGLGLSAIIVNVAKNKKSKTRSPAENKTASPAKS